ncbi:MAG: PD40 domain-containing protein [Myxococcales bacterium]|nr:PD40 domain-containing protein [Myxococcales bacterium]
MRSPRSLTRSCLGWLVASSCLGPVACAREAREPQPLGALPSAVTTAEPLFLPFAIRAGKAVAADPRERHLADLRRLTFDGRALHAVWSPDGRSLLVESAGAGDGCSSVAELDLEHGELRPVSPVGATAHGPAFDRDGSALFAVADPGPDCRGDVARSLGFEAPRRSSGTRSATGATPVGALGADASELARSPDGRAFAFTSGRDGNPELYLWTIGDAEPRRLTDRPGYDGMAAFSPDGTRLAWHGAADAPEALERPRGPRGTQPSAAAPRPAALGIFVAGSAGQHPVAVVAAAGLNVGPAFFPDSRRLVFASDREAVGATTGAAARDFELFRVDPDGPATATGGPALERLTYAAGFDGWARFSPDGKYLVFTSSRDVGRGAAPAAPGDTDVYVARWVD